MSKGMATLTIDVYSSNFMLEVCSTFETDKGLFQNIELFKLSLWIYFLENFILVSTIDSQSLYLP